MAFLLTTLADKQRTEWMFVNEVFFFCTGYSFSIEIRGDCKFLSHSRTGFQNYMSIFFTLLNVDFLMNKYEYKSNSIAISKLSQTALNLLTVTKK